MIWVLLKWLLAWLQKLVIPWSAWNYIPANPLRRQSPIDPNQLCPVCGATQGTIEAVYDANGKIAVEKQCQVCHVLTYFKPVTEVKADQAFPIRLGSAQPAPEKVSEKLRQSA